MKVLAIYAINEHIAELMVEAERARLARQGETRPSIARRFANAVRTGAARLAPSTTAAAA